jgi:hypothetical protein
MHEVTDTASIEFNLFDNLGTPDSPFNFFIYLFSKGGYAEFHEYYLHFGKCQGIDESITYFRMQGFLESESRWAVYVFLQSIPRQMPVAKKIKKVSDAYTLFNELYSKASHITKNYKLLNCFIIMGLLLHDNFKKIVRITLSFDLSQVTHRHIFKDEFLNRLLNAKLVFENIDECTLFSADTTLSHFKDLLLRKTSKKRKFLVQWEEDAFYFLLIKLEEQHVVIHYKSLEEFVIFLNRSNFKNDNFRQYRTRNNLTQSQVRDKMFQGVSIILDAPYYGQRIFDIFESFIIRKDSTALDSE